MGAPGGDSRTTTVEYLDDNTFLLQLPAADSTYGFSPANPIKVGGTKEQSGPRNQRRFLNALLGPGGEKVQYARLGGCCPFKTPNGLLDNTGLLDRYRVYWQGSKDTLILYLNMYDYGDLFIPNGFTARK